MLDQFATLRRTFLSERLGDWTEEERSTLLDLLRRFSATIANIEKTADVARSSGSPSSHRLGCEHSGDGQDGRAGVNPKK
jgi:hypothetical protein